MRDCVVLISIDAAVTRTVARRLRAEHICCRIEPAGTPAAAIRQTDVRGVIVAAESTGVASTLPELKDYLESGVPMLCLGDAALTLCELCGGKLSDLPLPGSVEEVQFDHGHILFSDVEDGERYLRACRYMTALPEQATPAAYTADGMLGFRLHQRDVWGLALQLERNDPGSTQLLLNFCSHVCFCTMWWNNEAFIERARAAITMAAGGGEALCSLSGGVDSGVCALLGHMALGSRLHCIFIDTGLLRKGEAAQVMDFYSTRAGLDLRRVDASAEFMAALEGVTDAAEKERIVFRLLQQVLKRETAAHQNVRLLIQGTNYTDVIRGSVYPLQAHAEDIAIIEPVRELFKDEVRNIGEDLGMTPAMLLRQPFPGSGLSGRIMGEVTPEKLNILREADAIFTYEITENNQHKRLWQYFAALSDATDAEGYMVTLRAVQTVDGAGGMAARLPNDLLERVTLEILRRCPQVRRVLFDLTPSKNYTPVETL
ncbi:MAG: hypothetical protein IJE07_13000 [Clostridia bacterium]|nr:hypothetical protein [Clostridia bacterium]